MVERTAKTMVIGQKVGSIVRRKGRCEVTLNDSGLTAFHGRSARPFVNIPTDSLNSVSVVATMKGRGSSFTPFRGTILQLEVQHTDGVYMVGIVVPREDAEGWREAAEQLLRSAA